jgi:two-component system sensor histidine kinase QseC
MAKRPSLTLQLMAGIGLPFLIVIGLIGAIAYFTAKDEITEIYDSQMITSAQQLSLIAGRDEDPSGAVIERKDHHLSDKDQAALNDYARWRTFRVWRHGQLVLESDGNPVGLTNTLSTGFSTLQGRNHTWRVFTYRTPETGLTVAVGESLEARHIVSMRVVWGVCVPLLFVLPLIILMVWLGIRFGLSDLTRFAGDVRRRSPDDMSRISSDALPVEIAPVAESVNHLMEKLERSLSQERLFTDNAAHELRTPLAALTVQADVLRNARTDAERQPMLDELSHGVERTARLLDQLLVLARIRHTPVQVSALNMYQAASEVIRDIYGKAHARSIELSLTGDENATVLSSRPLLTLLIGNLVNNAVKYAPDNSVVELSVLMEDQGAILTIRDHGPGIPLSEREQVFARFYRLKGRNESGSGLGLAIVRTLGELLAADIMLFTPDDGQGLGVNIRFNR